MKNQPGVKHGFKQKLRRAFTITELVIVIAVIAILAAVLIPTFSAVVSNSKKSHDEQYVKSINVALSNYTVAHGSAPKDYEELMLALAEEGLCDTSNPFLLATALKQDDMYIVWYPNTNSVVLLDGSPSSDYMVSFTSSVGLGNAVYTFLKGSSGTTTTLGYALCSTGYSDGKFIADAYYDYYVQSGGDVTLFVKNYGNKYSSANLQTNVNDVAWGNSILAAITNQKSGYTYSESIATALKEEAKNSSSLAIDITIPENGYVNASKEEQALVQQEVRAAIATVAQLANTTDTAAELATKKVSIASSSDALKDVVVDMSEVQMTPIGNVYRKDYSKNVVKTSSFSIDFCGLTIDNMKAVQNEFVASGAEFQTEQDCTYKGGAYVFTYGLFGTIHAAAGDKVTMSNVNITNVDMDLTGASTTIGGQTYTTITDMAGVVAGYTQGDVTFENITVSGANKTNGKGEFNGFDGVAGLVGRTYNNGTKGDSTFTMKNCTVSNLSIKGERRAAGFVAYASGVNIVAEDCKLENVDITCQRQDGGTGIYSGAFGHIANTVAVTLNGVEFKDVTTTVRYKPDNGSGTDWIYNYDPAYTTATKQGLEKSYYVKVGDKYVMLFHADDKGITPVIGTKGAKVVIGDKTIALTVDNMVRGTAITG